MKWRDRVQEYVRERGGGSLRNLEQARRVCQDRERWKKKKKKNHMSCGCREEVLSGGKSETTDVEVVWPHGANGGG